MRNESQSASVGVTIEPSGEPGLALFRKDAERGALVQPGTVVLRCLPDLTYDYEIEVVVQSEPRPRTVISSATIRARPDGGPVTSRQVGRELGLAHLHAVARLSVQVDREGNSSGRSVPLSEVRSAMQSIRTGPKPTPRDEVERAADAYLKAQALGRPTTAAVKAALGYSASDATARKRVMQARKAGLVPPTGGTTRPRL